LSFSRKIKANDKLNSVAERFDTFTSVIFKKMTLVNVSKTYYLTTLFNLSLAFMFLLKLFRGQIYSVLSFILTITFKK